MCYLHFINNKTEAQKKSLGQVNCPSQRVTYMAAPVSEDRSMSWIFTYIEPH